MNSTAIRYLTYKTMLTFLCMAIPIQIVQAETVDHPLFRAIKSRDDARLTLLVKQRTPVNIRSASGTTPLMTASLHGTTKSVQLLLAAGAEPNSANDHGVTPLMWAATCDEKVRLLLDRGANANTSSELGNTPLLIASALPKGARVVQMLLDQGADFTVRSPNGTSAIKNALIANSLETLQVLFAHAESQNAVDELVANDATSFLNDAALFGSVEIAAFLCDQLTKLNGGHLPDAGGAIAVALFAQNRDIAHLLLQRGAKPRDLRRPAKAPAMMFASYSDTDDVSILNALLERGLDPNGHSEQGDSALTWAHRRGHVGIIKELLAAGAKEQLDELPEIPSGNINLHAGNQQHILKNAIAKSIALLQRSSDGFLKQRSCTACHQNDLPAVAASWARDRGVTIDHGSLDRLIERQTSGSGAQKANKNYQLVRGVTNGPATIGYRLWEWSAIGYPANDRTESMVWFLAAIQQRDGSWSNVSARPPMGAGEMQATAMALHALQLYPIASRSEEFRQRIENAAEWLNETTPQNHQDRVFQLLGLSWAGRQTDELVDKTNQLVRMQREDGGWSQLPNLSSDAWATGQTLIALHIGGAIPTSDPAYQRGLKFLLNTQFDDGSWYVKSRSFPFQKPFESGFPHGRDQWISAPASAWASMAMTLAVSPTEVTLPEVIGGPVPEQVPTEAANLAGGSEAESGNVTVGVNFVRDIQPIFQRSCVNCHSGEKPRGGLVMTELAPLLQGGESGEPAIIPGASSESPLFVALSRKGDGLKMPPVDDRDDYPAISDEDITKLRRWIDDGATWPTGLKLKPSGY